MGFVFKPTWTAPIPQGAERFQKKGAWFARWVNTRGKTVTAPLTEDGTKVLKEAKTYSGRYRDADGKVINFPTKCRDKQGG